MRLARVTASLLALAGCKTTDPLFCDENKPCTDPARPFCDLTGQYPASEGIGKTCIPDPGLGTDAGAPDADPNASNSCEPSIAFARADGIYAIRPDGTGERRLASTLHHSAWGARWSPDSDLLVFDVSTDPRMIDGFTEIVRVRADGALQSMLTDSPGDNTQPSWSPSGTQIAFISTRNYPNALGWDLYVMDADGTNERLLAQEALDSDWSSEGTAVAFTSYELGRYQIFTVPPSGGAPTNLSNSALNEGSPRWSPDGTKIVYSVQNPSNQLHIMDTNGANKVPLAPDLATSVSASWSPDSKYVAFSSTADIFVLEVATGQRTNITNDQLSRSPASWSPDSMYVTFTSTRGGGDVGVFRARRDGADIVRLTNSSGEEERTPAWSPCIR